MVWTGEWVAGRLGVSLSGGDELPELLGLALRRNPKRAHLLVSNVLGKHVPQRPGVVHGAGFGLGLRVRKLLGDEAAARSVVLGYAETATGLGHSVADGLALAPYLHSTRRPVAGVAQVGGFEEEHSHATSHLLLPEDRELLAGDGPLVLVDDEFSTGRTVLNTIKALHERFPRERYVVVALVDMRSDADRGHLEKFAAELGARVDLVALAAGGVRLPAGVLARGQELVAAHEDRTAPRPPAAAGGTGAADVVRIALDWPAGLPDGGRHGFTPAHRERLEAALPGMAIRIAERLDGARRILVLGNEELMYAPLRMAEALDTLVAGEERGATRRRRTRHRRGNGAARHAPAAVRLHRGHGHLLLHHHPVAGARRRRPRVRDTDPALLPRPRRPADGPGERYAYNVAAGTDPERRFDAIVAVVDSHGDLPSCTPPTDCWTGSPHTPTDCCSPSSPPTPRNHRPDPCPSPSRCAAPPSPPTPPTRSAGCCRTCPTSTLEAPTEEREEAIQRGGAHYAESLPVEYQPNEQYQALFHSALRDLREPDRAGRRDRHRDRARGTQPDVRYSSRWRGPARPSAC